MVDSNIFGVDYHQAQAALIPNSPSGAKKRLLFLLESQSQGIFNTVKGMHKNLILGIYIYLILLVLMTLYSTPHLALCPFYNENFSLQIPLIILQHWQFQTAPQPVTSLLGQSTGGILILTHRLIMDMALTATSSACNDILVRVASLPESRLIGLLVPDSKNV